MFERKGRQKRKQIKSTLVFYGNNGLDEISVLLDFMSAIMGQIAMVTC